jgi:Zn-dependent peptidase ImmA (M78 family)
MKQRSASPFIDLRSRAWLEAGKFSNSLASGDPPVALHQLAKRLRIRRVEILPLMSTAGVVPIDDGYVIYLNEKAPGAEKVTKKCLEVNHEEFARLPPQLRFTIAHECAHVIYYNLVGGDYKNKLFRRHWQSLENSCNQIARLLLVPKKMLLAHLEGGLLDVERLNSVVKAFVVSPEVMMYRLNLHDVRDAFSREDGLVAYVRECNGTINVVGAFSVGSLSRIRWPLGMCAGTGISLDRLYLGLNAWALLDGKKRVHSDARVFWRHQQVIPCELNLKRIRQIPPAALLSIRVVGHVESSKAGLDAARTTS